MTKEHRITFKQLKLLKEIGYDKPPHVRYLDTNGEIKLLRPLLEDVKHWFRERKNINIYIVVKKEKWSYNFQEINNDKIVEKSQYCYLTYYEALSEAINLILKMKCNFKKTIL
jgi:hypothetical protein